MRPPTEDLDSMFEGYDAGNYAGIDPERAALYQLCEQNDVRLIEWPYSLEPTDRNVREIFQKERETDEETLQE